MKKYEHEFLSGYISPISWDQENEIKAYSIYTKYDEDIILMGKSVRKSFARYKNQKVKVFGHFLHPKDGARVFEVTQTNLDKRAA